MGKDERQNARLAAFVEKFDAAEAQAGLTDAEVVRQVNLRGVKLTSTKIIAWRHQQYAGLTPDLAQALEDVLGCWGDLTVPLGYLPAGMPIPGERALTPSFVKDAFDQVAAVLDRARRTVEEEPSEAEPEKAAAPAGRRQRGPE